MRENAFHAGFSAFVAGSAAILLRKTGANSPKKEAFASESCGEHNDKKCM